MSERKMTLFIIIFSFFINLSLPFTVQAQPTYTTCLEDKCFSTWPGECALIISEHYYACDGRDYAQNASSQWGLGQDLPACCEDARSRAAAYGILLGVPIDRRTDAMKASGTCDPIGVGGTTGDKGGCSSAPNVKMNSEANLKSGNIFHSQDISNITLSYNGIDNYSGPLGAKWTHNYDQKLTIYSDYGTLILKTEDGNIIYFRLSGSVYYPEDRSGDDSQIVKNADGTFTRTAKSGMIYNYNSSGNLTSVADRNGNTTTLTYSGSDLMSITDQNGRATTIATVSGKITAVTDALGRTYTLTYTGGLLSSITDPSGNAWVYTYDAAGRMLTKKDPGNFTITYTYDGSGRILTSTDPEGKVRTMNYVQSGSTEFTEKDGGLWTYTYDPVYAVKTAKTDPLGNTTHYTYDTKRNLISTIAPDGSTTTYTYDVNSNMTSMTDPLGNVTGYTYNALNLVATSTDPKGGTTSYAYDAKGNLISVTDPAGAVTQYAYDAKGNILSITDAKGKTTTFAYDAQNNLTSITDPLGKVTSFTYDAMGNRLTMTNPMGGVTSYVYNALNQMTQVTDPKGNITNYTYNYKGDILSATDANGNPTNYAYNYRGQVTQIKDALNNITQMTYGPSGCGSGCGGADKIASLTDALNHTTAYTYDAAGRLLAETDPEGGVTSYTYDAKGNMITKTKPDGRTITYAYDAAGRLLQRNYPNSTVNTFTYDQNGNMTMAANAYIAYYYSYDAANRLTGVTDSNLRNIEYQYDEAGNRKAMITPEGKKTTYTYNAAGRLTSINNYTGKYTYAYNANGQRTKLTYPNGTIATYHYNKNGDVNKIVHAKDSTIIDEITYTYNKINNRITRTDSRTAATYGYDAVSRLLSSSLGEAYTYDGVGNRLTGPNVTDVMTYNAGNEQLNLNAIAYEYDQNGNRIKKTGAGGVVTNYTYDDENRLIQVTKNNGTIITYAYDPFGRRISKTVSPSGGGSGEETTYVYDNEAIILAYNAAGNIKAKYTHGLSLDEPLAVKKSDDIYYYHADGLGSIIALTDITGAVVETYSYDSFGKMTKTGDINQPFTYTAREFDSETGLYYYRARYYDPKAGRFLQRDPIGFKGGINQYAYVKNNPVNLVDPWGLYILGDKVPAITNPAMEKFLKCMDKCTGKQQYVTATTNGIHQDPGHSAGTSADIRPTGTPSSDIFCCAGQCGAPFALDERAKLGKNWSGPHYHFQLVAPSNPNPKAPNAIPNDPNCKPCKDSK